MARCWCVAKVHRGREEALCDQVAPAGVEVYNPQFLVARNGRRRMEPLFPTYLFLNGDPEDESWMTVRRARGLKYLLGSDAHPSPVDDGIVETIRQRVAQWNGGGWRDVFRPGDRVLINAGPLKGLEAIFVKYVPARERCRVLIATLRSGQGGLWQHQHEVEIGLSMMSGPSSGPPLSAR